MTDLVEIILDLLKQGEDIVVGRVISVRGSSPREIGATMLIRRSGEIAGTIGGGLIEAAVREKAGELFANRESTTLLFDMTGDDLTAVNMVCGGKAEAFIEFLPANEHNIRVFEHIKNSKRKSPGCYLITQIGNARGEHGFNALLTDDSDINRELELLTIPVGLMDTVRSLEESALLNYEGKRLWVDVIKCNGVVYIMGAGHVSREVNDLAMRVGFSTVVMDDREEYANRARFKAADNVIVLRSFEQCFNGISLDSNSYVVIVTRGHMHDKQVLGQALLTDAGYIGMIGSTRKRDVIYSALIKEGFTAEQLARVHCPIGINIESKTPAEIAVSIIAELINVRAQKCDENK